MTEKKGMFKLQLINTYQRLHMGLFKIHHKNRNNTEKLYVSKIKAISRNSHINTNSSASHHSNSQ